MSGVRPGRWWLIAALGIAGWIATTAGPAGAHATLQSTTPAADELLEAVPPEVELRFDEGVDADLGGIRVFGPDGGRVDDGTVDSREGGLVLAAEVDGDARGTYTVAYNVVSADGHAIQGSFVFHVGEQTGSVGDTGTGRRLGVEVVGAVGRWLTLAGTLVAVGALAFAGLVAYDDPGRPRLRRLALVAAATVVAGTLVALLADTAEASGRSLLSAVSIVADGAPEARFGQLAIARLLCAVAFVAALLPPWHADRPRPLDVLLPAPAAALLLVVAAVSGHAWTSSARWTAVATDVAHLVAAAVWGGGLLALLITGRERGELAVRFSKLALAAVGLVVVTGSISGYLQVRSLDGLLTTAYGRVLVAKVGFVAVLVVLGWINRSRLLAAVERHGTLLAVVRAEVAVVAVVVALTAVLVDSVPPRDLSAEPFSGTVMAEQRGVRVDVQPAQVGENDIHLYFVDAQGAPTAVDAAEVTVAIGDVPPRPAALQPILPSHFSAYGVDLPTAGRWRVQVTWVREGVTESATVEVPVR